MIGGKSLTILSIPKIDVHVKLQGGDFFPEDAGKVHRQKHTQVDQKFKV